MTAANPTGDTAMARKPPMTEAEAHAALAEIEGVTPPLAQVALIKLALARGNLSDEARAVYRQALDA